MIAFLVQRLYQAVLVMLTVGLIAFALFNYVGDPINSMVGQDTSLADRDRLRQELGLNDGFIVQFARFVGRAARGEFGLSYQQARPVGQIILEKMPATLELSFVAATLALAIGVPMGIYTGLHRQSWLSQLLLALSLVGVSLPTFLIGILLILVFAVTLGWLPSFGRGSVVQFGWWSSGLVTLDGWRAIILPAVTLSLFQMTLITRLVRVITIAGLQLGSIIAFAIITETVFQWPGMGLMFIQAVTFVDIPVMAAYLVLVGFFFVVINLIVDLLYHVLDPRLRVDRERVGVG